MINIDKSYYDQNGYLIIAGKNILSLKNEIKASLREMALTILINYYSPDIYEIVKNKSFDEILDYCISVENNNEISKVFYELFTSNMTLNGLAVNRLFQDISRQLGLNYPVPSTMPLIRIDRPKDETYLVPAHQDFWSSMNCLNSVTYWFSLVDLSPELGFLKVVPGSHKLGPLPMRFHKKENPYILKNNLDLSFIDVNLKEDELLVFSQLLVHKSGKNVSEKTRISIQVRHNDLTNLNPVSSSYVVNPSSTTSDLQKKWLEKSNDET